MRTQIKTFRIRDAHAEDDEARLSEFLRTIEVKRIETAYANNAWQILVMYEELRRKEESRQIESALVAALTAWRNQTAAAEGVAREAVLPDAVIAEIARSAPTTSVELAAITASRGWTPGPRAGAIVQVVRQKLADLVG